MNIRDKLEMQLISTERIHKGRLSSLKVMKKACYVLKPGAY